MRRNTGFELFRGVAAAMVLLGHVLSCSQVRPFAGKTVFLFSYGHEAVIGFFVLSGIVNRMSIGRRRLGSAELLWQRMQRLLPQYWIVVSLSSILLSVLSGVNATPQFFGHMLFVATNKGELIRCLASNPVLWSMSFEAFFYLCFSLCLTKRHALMPLWLAVSLVACLISPFMQLYGASALLLKMLGYSFAWLVGFYIPEIRRSIHFPDWSVVLLLGCIPIVTNLGLNRPLPLWFGATSLMIAPVLLRLYGSSLGTPSMTRQKRFIGSLLACLVASILCYMLLRSAQPARRVIPLLCLPTIAVAMSPLLVKFGDWLTRRFSNQICVFGRASFPLYLTHMPILYLGLYAELDPLPLIGFVIVATALSCWILEWRVQPSVAQMLAAWTSPVRCEVE